MMRHILCLLVRHRLRTCSLTQSHQCHLAAAAAVNVRLTHSNSPSVVEAGAPPKKKVLLKMRFDRFFEDGSDADAKLKQILSECDTDEEEWIHNTTRKMLALFIQREPSFGSLTSDQIERLKNDYRHLAQRQLATPKLMNSEMEMDLNRLWHDEKSRIHLLAYHGIKQLKKFKELCRKQIKWTFREKYNGDCPLPPRADDCRSEAINTLYFKLSNKRYDQHLKMLNTVYEGQNLVLDFSLSKHCLYSEQNSIASQAQRIISHNLDTERPFNLWFTSLAPQSKAACVLTNQYAFSPAHFVNRTEQHFIELFPREKLIYLSPDADEMIDEFDRSAIYVLGAIVDRYEDRPLSRDSSRAHQVRSMRLPLEKYVLLSDLSKDLSFLSVFKMLNFMQMSYANWDKAFKQFLQPDRRVSEMELIEKFNPSRSLKKYSETEMERYKQSVKYRNKHRIFEKMKN